VERLPRAPVLVFGFVSAFRFRDRFGGMTAANANEAFIANARPESADWSYVGDRS